MIKDSFKPVRLSLGELSLQIENFLKAASDKSPETRATYQRALREFSTYFVRSKHFLFRVEDVEAYRNYLEGEKGFQSVSVSTYMTALRRLCQYLVDSRILEKNPARRVRGGRRPSEHKRTFLTLQEIACLYDSIRGESIQDVRDLAIIKTMLGCACSDLEITRANVGDMQKRGRGWVLYVQGKGKSIKDEVIPVPAETMATLQGYLAARTDNPGPEDPLFISCSNRSRNARITIRGVREAVSARLKSSGVKRGRDGSLTPFSLRHTAGILLAESGASPEELMHRMRIEWRPTAMLYFRQRGKLRSSEVSGARRYMALESKPGAT